MKGKRLKENKGKNNKIIIMFMYLIFMVILIYSGLKIFNWYKDNKQTNEIIGQIEQNIKVETKDKKTEYKIDFTSLLKQNKDTVGWLKVNGTNIEYPVVKSSNNDYYLTHSFDCSYNSAGWVFADYKNKLDGTDKNIVIYGHNRKDGSIFGSLKNILTKEWQNNEENYVIKFYTPKVEREYRVFSVYKIENEDYYIKTSFKDKEYSDFIKTIANRSIKKFDKDISENNNILTLSTCADNNKYRVVLHAREI